MYQYCCIFLNRKWNLLQGRKLLTVKWGKTIMTDLIHTKETLEKNFLICLRPFCVVGIVVFRCMKSKELVFWIHVPVTCQPIDTRISSVPVISVCHSLPPLRIPAPGDIRVLETFHLRISDKAFGNGHCAFIWFCQSSTIPKLAQSKRNPWNQSLDILGWSHLKLQKNC